jgi:PAS domain S-box-containing protein
MDPNIQRQSRESFHHHSPGKIDSMAIFEATPDPYLILDPEFHIVAVNDSYLSATLTERGKIIGRGIFEVFPDNPDDQNANGVSNLRASLEKVLVTKKPHRMEIQKYDIPIEGSGFEERYWSPLNTPVLNERNEVLYIIQHVENVTEMVKTRQQANELEISEARFRMIANAMPQIVWTANSDGTSIWYNDWYYEITGAPKKLVKGEWLNYLHPDDQLRVLMIRQKSIESRSNYSI